MFYHIASALKYVEILVFLHSSYFESARFISNSPIVKPLDVR